jgi:hypothetical protein
MTSPGLSFSHAIAWQADRIQADGCPEVSFCRKGLAMADIERNEMQRHRDQLAADVRKLVEKYRAIFDWDVPDIDQGAADKLILGEIRGALEEIERQLLR